MKKKTLRKIVIAVSALGTAIGFVLFFNEELGICRTILCDWILTGFAGNFIVLFFAAFFFSIIGYFVADKTYRNWLIFSVLWVSISFLVDIKINPVGGGSFGGLHEAFNGLIILSLWVLYPVLSAIIMLVTWLVTRKKPVQKA